MRKPRRLVLSVENSNGILRMTRLATCGSFLGRIAGLMRTRDDILTEVDYLGLIAKDCSQASQRITSAARSLQLAAPNLLWAPGSFQTRRLAMEVAFEELCEAQEAMEVAFEELCEAQEAAASLMGLVEGRLRMITGELE